MAGNPTGRRSMRKTLVSSLVFLLISIGCTGTAEAQLASPQCDACRKACINARESCKVYACLTSGGQPGPSSCQGPNATCRLANKRKVLVWIDVQIQPQTVGDCIIAGRPRHVRLGPLAAFTTFASIG